MEIIVGRPYRSELRPRPFELVQLLRCQFERVEVVNAKSSFHHFVRVEFELFVVSPFELFEVIGLERHRKHVFERETESNAIVYGVRHAFPLDFVFYEILRDEALDFECGERRAQKLRQFFFSEKVPRSVPHGSAGAWRLAWTTALRACS